MDNIRQKFSNKFRNHWIEVKFYKKEPKLKYARKLKDVKFCEATKEAILGPVLLDKESINCKGAQYVFGWQVERKDKNYLIDTCQVKRQAEKDILLSMLSHIPRFKEPFKYIGLNTEGKPDLIMSYLMPKDVMNLLKIYNNNRNKNLDVSLPSMMPICGGIAVETYRKKKMSLSFGCDDSRKYAHIGKARLAVGIPKNLFKVFVG